MSSPARVADNRFDWKQFGSFYFTEYFLASDKDCGLFADVEQRNLYQEISLCKPATSLLFQ